MGTDISYRSGKTKSSQTFHFSNSLVVEIIGNIPTDVSINSFLAENLSIFKTQTFMTCNFIFIGECQVRGAQAPVSTGGLAAACELQPLAPNVVQ